MSLDAEATIAEFARFSERDAAAYARMLEEWADVRQIFGQDRFRPIGYGPSTEELLDAHPRASVWRRRRMMSAYDVIMHEFEDRHSQAFLLWMSFQTIVALDRPGTGLLAYSLIAARQKNSWSIPVGGSGTLVDALVGYLEDHDVTIECDQTVAQLVIEDGKCVGSRRRPATATWRARVSSRRFTSNTSSTWLRPRLGRRLLVRRRHVRGRHLGLRRLSGDDRTTDIRHADGGRTAVSAGIVGWPDQILRMLRDVNDGVAFDDVPFLLVRHPPSSTRRARSTTCTRSSC